MSDLVVEARPELQLREHDVEKKVDSAVWSWCVKEMAYWLSHPVDYEELRRILPERNAQDHYLHVLEINGSEISIWPKTRVIDTGSTQRINDYVELIREALDAYGLSIRTVMAIAPDDGGGMRYAGADIPIFSFQKPAGGRTILLPDVDLVRSKFFQHNTVFADRLPYIDKKCSAVFVGSSTGGNITKDIARSLAMPRLRSAFYFRDSDLVVFRVPRLVQYDSEETKAILEAMGLGVGDRISWDEQFRHKFIISVDGNGATCARVFHILRSNSVLLKYASPHVLHYFSSLVPWHHYIPIENDDQVEPIVAVELDKPGLFHHIALNGQSFARDYLNYGQALKYTAWLLNLYSETFANARSASVRPKARSTVDLRVLGHVRNKGDVWCDEEGWVGHPASQLAIEGFSIELGGGTEASDVQYKALCSGGQETDWCNAREFCGSRGRSTPLTGICVRLSATAARRFFLTYRVSFLNGPTIEGEAGKMCSVGDASIVALQIKLTAQ